MRTRVVFIVVLLLLASRTDVVHAQVPAGSFATTPNFSASGQAAAVFLGGSIEQLEGAARASGASGVWAQDAGGAFQLLVVGGPAFLRDTFASRFPGGFPSAVAVTLTRPPGASGAPAPVPTATPSAPTLPATPKGVPGPSTND